MKILMAIPTWNRGPYLDRAIAAIAAARAATSGCEVELFISNNASSDTTDEVCARWTRDCPWITASRFDDHVDGWDQVFRRLLANAPEGYDYLWIQGDDDHLVEVSAFDQVASAVAASAVPPAFVHCTQQRRSRPGDQRVLAGNFEALANEVGWLELLGWISSLVVSGATVQRVLASGHWQYAASSSFTHSELLLEALYGEPTLILAAGLMEPQDEHQTPECIERWKNSQVGKKYWMAIPNLLRLQANGLFRQPLAAAFFRYHRYSLWDRFAAETVDVASYLNTQDEVLEIKLNLLADIAKLLGYGQERKLYEDWLEGFTDEIWEIRRALRKIGLQLERTQRSAYDFALLPPPQA